MQHDVSYMVIFWSEIKKKVLTVQSRVRESLTKQYIFHFILFIETLISLLSVLSDNLEKTDQPNYDSLETTGSQVPTFDSLTTKKQKTKFMSANFPKILSPSYTILRIQRLEGKQGRSR